MATLQADGIADLIASVLPDLGRNKWQDLTTDIQKFTAMPMIMKKNKVSFKGGTGIKRNFQMDTLGNARHTGLFETDNTNINDTMVTAEIPWRHTTTSWAIERREISMNMGAEEIFDLLKTRRHGAIVDLAELQESTLWGKPVDSTDTKTPYGIKYWVVANNTEGFNGGNPAGFSAGAAGLDSTVYPRWRNYSGQYTTVSKANLIKMMRKAHILTKFTPPTGPVSSYDLGGPDCQVYVNYSVLAAFEEVGESQNENLGRDIASMDGQIMFRRCPINYVPKLDEDTSNPVYMLDWSKLYVSFLSGEYMRETGPKEVANQHNTLAVHIDNTWNMMCHDRRAQTVFTL